MGDWKIDTADTRQKLLWYTGFQEAGVVFRKVTSFKQKVIRLDQAKIPLLLAEEIRTSALIMQALFYCVLIPT